MRIRTSREPGDRFTPSTDESDAASDSFIAKRRAAPTVFESGDVSCQIDLVAIDRSRKLARYEATLKNKLGGILTCRIFDTERKTRLAGFDVLGDSLERARFDGRLETGKRSERVCIDIMGEGTALSVEMRLPQARRAAPVGGLWIAAMLGTIGFALVILLVFGHVRLHATEVARRTTLATSESTQRSAFRTPPYDPIDDAILNASSGFTYTGLWQHIKGMRDGRSNGTSSRSYHAGDRADLRFYGSRFEVFGIEGPTGGSAELKIDGRALAVLRFYAPHKGTRVNMFVSPPERLGKHSLEIRVLDASGNRRYVNIDGAAYTK